MDKRDFTLIENETKIKEKPATHQTNPIAKKFLEFHKEKIDKFSVKELFKK